MRTQDGFTLMDKSEVKDYLAKQKVTRTINRLQVHHMDEEHYDDLNPDKFMVLCRACHSYIERLARIKPENRYKYNPVWVEFCSRAFIVEDAFR